MYDLSGGLWDNFGVNIGDNLGANLGDLWENLGFLLDDELMTKVGDNLLANLRAELYAAHGGSMQSIQHEALK